MAFENQLEECAAQILKAQVAVGEAANKYSEGAAPLRRLNEANRALADARARYREASGNVVPDRRQRP